MVAMFFGASATCLAKKDNTPMPPGDVVAAINAANLRAHWTNTVGLGLRIQTPLAARWRWTMAFC